VSYLGATSETSPQPVITGRELTSGEVAAFLARHPATAARVAYHNTTSALYCYPVGEGTMIPGAYEWERETLGIPWRGLYVPDSGLEGTVTIFPDATCDLHYSVVGDPGGVLAATASRPDPEAVPHDRNVFDDLVDFASVILPLALLAGLIMGRR